MLHQFSCVRVFPRRCHHTNYYVMPNSTTFEDFLEQVFWCTMCVVEVPVLVLKLGFTVLACRRAAMAVVEPYNTVLHADSVLEHTDATVMADHKVTSSLLVQTNVQPYAPYWYTMGCEDGRISKVIVSGTFVGESNVNIRRDALHAEESFVVRVGEGPWQELSWRTAVVDNASTFVSSPGVTITGVITTLPREFGHRVRIIHLFEPPDRAVHLLINGTSSKQQNAARGRHRSDCPWPTSPCLPLSTTP